jgi:ADP-ribosylglycohydrolase
LNNANVVRSALWAAYGDALGFITEFRDANGVRRKIAVDAVTRPLAWHRRVGGKFGPTVELPDGCYSDDTQLRLATSRAIRGDGTFDVEAFAKVELPVFLAYHLGAGRGTKAAARNLERKDVAWYSNFFSDDGTSYLMSGGNGAAMRIQPHVWAEPRERKGPSKLGLNVLRNALTTHGHPRGFLGALFHAQCLHMALRDGRIADPAAWMRFTEAFSQVPDMIASDEHLDRVWRPAWEQQAGRSLRDAIREVQSEHAEDIRIAADRLFGAGNPRDDYRRILRDSGGLAKETVGSGTKTVLFAAVLAYLYREIGVEEAVVVASNELGSDTDTIATMAGALLGSLASAAPLTMPLDAKYLAQEGERMARISRGERVPSFQYPDLLYWRAPKTQLDAVGLVNGAVSVAGLGLASSTGKVAKSPNQKNVEWEWLCLSFGQTVLAKRRTKLAQLPPYAMPHMPAEPRQPTNEAKARSEPVKPRSAAGYGDLFDRSVKESPPEQRKPVDRIDKLTDDTIRSDFHPVVVGKNLLELLDNSETPLQDAIAYAAIIAKARLARSARRRGRPNGGEPTGDR